MSENFWLNALRTGVPFGIGMGMYFEVRGQNGLVAGPVMGLVFGVLLAAFAAWQKKRMGVQGGVLDGERVVHEGAANHSAGLEKRGGWLVLTERAFVFRSHGLNVQNAPLRLPLDEVTGLEPARTLGLFPNAIRIRTGDGAEAHFVVNDRSGWLRAYSRAVGR